LGHGKRREGLRISIRASLVIKTEIPVPIHTQNFVGLIVFLDSPTDFGVLVHV